MFRHFEDSAPVSPRRAREPCEAQEEQSELTGVAHTELTGDRRQETGDRRLETGDWRQKTEDRRLEAGVAHQQSFLLPPGPEQIYLHRSLLFQF